MGRDLTEEEEDAQQLKLGGEFQRSKCLLNAEVIELLESRKQFMEENNADTTTTPLFDKSLEYARRFRKYSTREAAAEVRNILTRSGLQQFEICAMGNLCPVSTDEAKAVQASLIDPNHKDEEGNPNQLNDDDIEKFIGEMTQKRRLIG